MSTATPVLVFGHVDADHFLVVAKQVLGNRLCELRLADAGRPEEKQHAVRTIESILERALVQNHPASHGFHRIGLADHALAQLLRDVAEPIRHVADDHVFRDTGRLRDHRDNIRCAYVGTAIDLSAHRRRVEPADGLVGQPQMAQVARRQVQRRLDGVVVDPHAVVPLEAWADVAEDPPRLVDRRLGDLHRSEPTRERLVFLDELLVLTERGGADDANLAARQDTLEDIGRVSRRAERRSGADQRVRLVDEQNQVRPLLQLAEHVLNAVLEHAAQHRPGNEAVQLQADHLAIAEAHWERFGLELDAACEALGNCRLAHAGLADQHHGVRALAVAQDFHDLLDLGVAAEHGRQLVLAGQQIQVRREMLQKRRELELLAKTLLVALDVADAGGDARHERFGVDAGLAKHSGGHSLAVLEQRREDIGRFDRRASGASGVVERQLEYELRRRRHAQLARIEPGLSNHLILDGVKNGLGIQIQVAHDGSEEIPLRLRKREKQVFVADRGVLPSPSIFDRTVHQPLRGFTDLAGSDVEIFQGERASWPSGKQDWVQVLHAVTRDCSGQRTRSVGTI